MRFCRLICITALLCLFAPGESAVAQVPPLNCGPATDCGQRMNDLSEQLTKENQLLAHRIANLERDLALATDRIKQLAGRAPALLDRGGDRNFPQSEFWTGQNPSHVNYTCPDRNVLVGMEFEMSSDGFGRHPSRIKFICRQLSP
jgi:hypothetical protein